MDKKNYPSQEVIALTNNILKDFENKQDDMTTEDWMQIQFKIYGISSNEAKIQAKEIVDTFNVRAR